MKRRLLLWCGKVDSAKPLDLAASRADIDVALRAALARGVAAEDVSAFVCRRDLLPESFRGRLVRPDIDSFEKTIAAMARAGAPSDATLFVATNHGANRPEARGLVADLESLDEFAPPRSPAVLSPERLGELLDRLPGRKVLLIGTCFAGRFCELGAEGRLVLAACGDDDTLRISDDPPGTLFLHKVLGSWAAAESFDDAFARACHDPPRRGDESPILPRRGGSATWPD